MHFDSRRWALAVGALVATGALCACTTDGVDARTAGLRGPIEARGPATAGEATTSTKKEETGEAETPAFMHFDRERDRWYYFDERRQIYRWENGEPKK